MKIGLTYDLRQDYLKMGYSDEETAEFDKPDTIEAIEASLQQLGHETEPIGNVFNLVSRLALGERWDLVFNIAEGLRGFGREAQVPALLDAYHIPYVFSDPLVLALTLHKAMTKHVIRDQGIPTPGFIVVESETDIAGIRLPFPLFAKPVAEGTGKGISAVSKISSPEQLYQVCSELLQKFHQPVLVETYLPGREYTAGIVGTGRKARCLGVMEVILKNNAEHGVYSYSNKENYHDCVEYRLVEGLDAAKAAEIALAAWKGLNCRDGGRVDLREDKAGVPNFVEVNPLAGLHPVHSDLPILCRLKGIPYTELIRTIIESALERIYHA